MKKRFQYILIMITLLVIMLFVTCHVLHFSHYTALNRNGNYAEKSDLLIEIIKNKWHVPDVALTRIAYLMGENDISYRSSSYLILERNIDRWNVYADALVNMLKYDDEELTMKIVKIFTGVGTEAKKYLNERLNEEKAKEPGDQRLKSILENIVKII